jgi:hypothetical protein
MSFFQFRSPIIQIPEIVFLETYSNVDKARGDQDDSDDMSNDRSK